MKPNPLRGVPEYAFDGEPTLFLPSSCDHGADPSSRRTDDQVAGDAGEDHLVPPYAFLPESYSEALLAAEVQEDEEYRTAVANPVPPMSEVRQRAMEQKYELINELGSLRGDLSKYIRMVNRIAKEYFSLTAAALLPSNPKLEKGAKYSWRCEGNSFLPNTLAGLGDLCPYRSKQCTVSCLNISGHAEMSARRSFDYIAEARGRRALLYYHMPDVFYARIASLLRRRRMKHDHYAIRLNVMSDLNWESQRFYDPWEQAELTFMEAFPDIQFYDYTKNCLRYLSFLQGGFPDNYHLTLSLSEINALFAFYALDHGGKMTMLFNVPPKRDPIPLPETFCGYPVVDGDLSDIRFADRAMFGIPDGQGFVVGLRLKGSSHRRRYAEELLQGNWHGFIFEPREYDRDEVIANSEQLRQDALTAKSERGLPGDRRERFAGIPKRLLPELNRWWRGS